MKVTKGLSEIFKTSIWDLHPDELNALRSAIMRNAALGIEVESASSFQGSFLLSAKQQFQDRLYIGDADVVSGHFDLEADDRIINVLSITGPITRDGGGCSYGSRDHRDWLMRAADMEQTIGHIIIIDSPGGSAASKYDYEQAIDYIHSKGQKVIAFIDGMADSAGYAIAAMCDEIYVMNLSNQVGCIGSMCAFYIQRHGDVNAVTQERYIELYAEGSPYKNREMREAAEEKYDSWIAYLNKSAEDFKALVRKNRPNVTEEQMLGDTYEAREVMGSLIDGQKTFDECVERLLEISGYTMVDGLLVPPAANGDADEDENQESKQVIENNNNNQKTEDMSLEYPRIMAATKAHALEAVNEAVYLHKDLAEELEAHLAATEDTAAALTAKTSEVVALTEKINAMEKAHAEAIEKLNQEHTATLDTLKSEHETALKDAADKAAAEMEQMKSEHASAVAELNDKLAEATATIDAKEAEIVELAGKPAAQDKGEAPADNATVVRKPDTAEQLNVCKQGMSASEKREAMVRRMEELRLRRNG